jgi:hypothetical protein
MTGGVGITAAVTTGIFAVRKEKSRQWHADKSQTLASRGSDTNLIGVDSLHAMQFRASTFYLVSGRHPIRPPCGSDRHCPLHTPGARSLWHVGGTAGENDDARTWRRRLPARQEAEAR